MTTVEEVRCKFDARVRKEFRCENPDVGHKTSENLGFLSQVAQREGDANCECSLGGGDPRDDMDGGRPHEEVLSSPIFW